MLNKIRSQLRTVNKKIPGAADANITHWIFSAFFHINRSGNSDAVEAFQKSYEGKLNLCISLNPTQFWFSSGITFLQVELDFQLPSLHSLFFDYHLRVRCSYYQRDNFMQKIENLCWSSPPELCTNIGHIMSCGNSIVEQLNNVSTGTELWNLRSHWRVSFISDISPNDEGDKRLLLSQLKPTSYYAILLFILGATLYAKKIKNLTK